MANRLTEVENWNVLLLEAGGDETEISDVPLMAGFLQLSKLDWKYKTEPQAGACLGKTVTIILLTVQHCYYLFLFICNSYDRWTM